MSQEYNTVADIDGGLRDREKERAYMETSFSLDLETTPEQRQSSKTNLEGQRLFIPSLATEPSQLPCWLTPPNPTLVVACIYNAIGPWIQGGFTYMRW